MKRVMVTSVSAGGSSSGKDKATPDLMQLCGGGKHAGGSSPGTIWTDYNSHDPGAPSLDPTLDSPEPQPVPAGIEHEDIGGGGTITAPGCVCVGVPVPCPTCPSGWKSVIGCSGACSGAAPGPEPVPTGIEHEDIGAPKIQRKCVCIDVPIPCGSCPGGFKTQTFCGGYCGGGGGDSIVISNIGSS
jgi:hypothetical protein